MRIVNDFLVYELPGDEVLDMDEIEKIVEHTHNTWEPGRSIEAIRENTIQGKKAEYVIECYLRTNSEYRYKSYDSIRKDDYKKHAPFDGILYSSQIPAGVLRKAEDAINTDVASSPGDSGTITEATKKMLEDNKIYTMEVKSSKLQDPRDYKNMSHKGKTERTDDDYKALCDHIKGFYDYFVYPHFCRDSETIKCFYDYAQYCKEKRYMPDKNAKAFLTNLIEVEFANACVIYTRVFIDVVSNEIVIPGYVIKTRFFEEPRIQKMPSEKSEKALYFMYHMSYGTSFLAIDDDAELKEYDRTEAQKVLFAKKRQLCPKCGKELSFVELKQYRKYSYVCNSDECKDDNSRWHQWDELYPTNMSYH